MKLNLSFFGSNGFLLFIILVLVGNDCFGQIAASKTRSDILRIMKQDSIPGTTAAVIKNGAIVYEKYEGFANLEYGIPVNKNSVFQIASVSKQFTAVAIMMLAEQGKVKLNAKVSAYLPDAPQAWNAINISMLLSHCSGLMNYEDIPGFTEKAYLDSAHSVVLTSILHALYRQSLRFQPGTKSEYCNSNYFLLGAIIEKITGNSFEYFLTERILRPLHMQQTGVNEMYHIVKYRVAGYTTSKHELINADRLGMDWFFAEGNIITTLGDLVKWVQLTDHDKLMNPESISEMLTARRLSDGSVGKFGYGWFIETGSPGIFYHSGHTPGFSAFVYKNALKKTEVVLMMNNDGVATPKLLALAKAIDQNY